MSDVRYLVGDGIDMYCFMFRAGVPFGASHVSMPGPRDVRVPRFFEEAADASSLVDALARVISNVHRITGKPPDVVEVGRFTFLELLAFNELSGKRYHASKPFVQRETNSLTFGGGYEAVEIVPAFGPDHFIRATPFYEWLMVHGVQPSFMALPKEKA